jgi:hypothetical protein
MRNSKRSFSARNISLLSVIFSPLVDLKFSMSCVSKESIFYALPVLKTANVVVYHELGEVFLSPN